MKLYAEYINNFDSASQRLKTLLATPEGFHFFEVLKKVRQFIESQETNLSLGMQSKITINARHVSNYGRL